MPPRKVSPRFSGTGFEVLAGLAIDVRYASPAFAVTEWRCHEHRRSVSTGKHQPWHVLGFVHGGSFRLAGPRGGGVADPARLLAFRAGEEYETAHPSCCGDFGSAIAIAGAVAEELEGALGEGTWAKPLRALEVGLFARHLDLLRRLRRRPSAPDLAIDEALYSLAAGLLGGGACARTGVAPRRGRERVAAAQELLELRLGEPLPLAELACAVELSPFELCRQFRRETGTTVHRYRTLLRVAHGLDRLAREPGGRLVDLALDLGFDSHSHFTDVFRRTVGRTPSAFRARSPRPALRLSLDSSAPLREASEA
jgi:AraC-like DNA-binding protein